MTWGEVKEAALHKMFSGVDMASALSADEGVKEYLAAMPQAANEGLQQLAAAKPLLKVLEIVQNPPQNLWRGAGFLRLAGAKKPPLAPWALAATPFSTAAAGRRGYWRAARRWKVLI